MNTDTPSPTPCGPINFVRTDQPVVSSPSAIVADDFNHDGKLDMALSNADGIAIYPGNGNGSFQSPLSYTLGTTPDAIADSDFNRDGNFDLAIVNVDSGNVSVLLGNGDGSFHSSGTYTVGVTPVAIVAADFSHDGNPDLAVINYHSYTLSVLIGNGDGSFQPQVSYSIDPTPESIVAADINLDGNLDLVLTAAGNYMVLLGNGDGSFQNPVRHNSIVDAFLLTTSDFNRDGKPDLAMSDAKLSSVDTYLGNGDGTFQNGIIHQVGQGPGTVAAGDFNHDGYPDIVSANLGGGIGQDGSATVLLGAANGSFQPVTFHAGSNPEDVVVGDFNNDSSLDYVVTNFSDSTVSVELNTCGGATTTPVPTITPTPTHTPTITVTGTPPTVTPTPCIPQPDGWRNEPSLLNPREQHASASAGGKLYAIGGGSPTGIYTSVETFDPATQVWTNTAPLIYREVQMSAATIGDNIYVPGGFIYSGGMEIYNAISGTWHMGTPLPDLRLAEGVTDLNGKVYIAGGTDTFAKFNNLWAYDPISDTYSVLAPMPQGSFGIAALALQGHIYVFGGVNEFLHYVYDPAANAWSSVAPGLTANFYSPASFVLNGEIWLVGGDNAGNQPYPANQQVQIYNPGTNTWRYGPALNTPRRWPAGAVLNGRGYISGGEDMAGNLLTSVESIGYSGCGTPVATSTPISTPPTFTPTSTSTTFTPIPTAGTATQLPTFTHTPMPPTPSPVSTIIGPTLTPTITSTPTDCPNVFVDIAGNIFYSAIHYLTCAGVVSGTDAMHYSPAGTSTRGQFAKVVVLGFGLSLYTPTGSGQDFTDVPPSNFAYLYIESGYHASILSGYDAATCQSGGALFPCYFPNRAITRAQLTKLVVSAAHYPLYTPIAGQTFSDVPPSNIFYAFVETAHQKGVINGYPDDTFRPNNNIRRDEMAQIVYKGVTTP